MLIPVVLIIGALVGGATTYFIVRQNESEQFTECVNELMERGISRDKALRLCYLVQQDEGITVSDILKGSLIGVASIMLYRTFIEKRGEENEDK